MTPTLNKQLEQAIIEADRRKASELLMEWLKENDIQTLVKDVITPVMESIGDAYSGEQMQSVAQGYVAAKVANQAMEQVMQSRDIAESQTFKGPVVIGNIEDDFHGLGRIIVHSMLQIDGWKVIDMGNDVTAGEFVDAALEHNAKVIGASAMMMSTAVNIAKVRKELDERGLSGTIMLAVGGAVFNINPDLVNEVGGDGTCQNAINVPALMDELWNRATGVEEDL